MPDIDGPVEEPLVDIVRRQVASPSPLAQSGQAAPGNHRLSHHSSHCPPYNHTSSYDHASLPVFKRRHSYASWSSPPLRNSLIAFLEILEILEILVHARKPHIGHFVQIAQRLEDRFAHFRRRDLRLAGGTKVLLDPLPQLFRSDSCTGLPWHALRTPEITFIAIERLKTAGPLLHQQRSGLQRGEATVAVQAETPATDGVSVLADTSLNDLGFRMMTIHGQCMTPTIPETAGIRVLRRDATHGAVSRPGTIIAAREPALPNRVR